MYSITALPNEMLCEIAASVGNAQGLSALERTCKHLYAVAHPYLRAQSIKPCSGRPVVVDAAYNGDVSKLRFLLKNFDKKDLELDQLWPSPPPGHMYPTGRTPLFIALDQGHLEFAKILLEEGADPNIANDVDVAKSQLVNRRPTPLFGVLPLQLAIAKKDAGLMELLMKYGAKRETYCIDLKRRFRFPIHLLMVVICEDLEGLLEVFLRRPTLKVRLVNRFQKFVEDFKIPEQRPLIVERIFPHAPHRIEEMISFFEPLLYKLRKELVAMGKLR